MFGYITEVTAEQIPAPAIRFYIEDVGEVFFFPASPIFPGTIGAAVQNISKRPKFAIPRSAMLEAFDNPQLIGYGPGVLEGWDVTPDVPPPGPPVRDAEEERQWINLIILPPLVINQSWDSDAENQLYLLNPIRDDVTGDGVRNIIIPPFVSFEPDHEPTLSIFLQVPRMQDWTIEANFLFLNLRRCFALSAGLLTPQAQELLAILLTRSQVTAALCVSQIIALGGMITPEPRAQVTGANLTPRTVVTGGGIYV